MSRPCSICAHPDRAAIDRALLEATEPIQGLAARLGVSTAAIYRHRRNHPALVVPQPAPIPPETAPEATATASSPEAGARARAGQQSPESPADGPREVIDTFHQLRAINGACLEVLREARSQKQPLVLLRAVDRITKQIDLQGKLLGKIQEAQTIDIAVLPEWHDTRQVVLDALRPYPEARDAVVQALREAAS